MIEQSDQTEYLDKRARQALMAMNELRSTEYKVDEAEVVVDWAYIPLIDHRENSGKRVVTIYVAGMPHSPKQNAGGDAQEIGIIPELLTGEATDLIVLKPEGLNKEAFDNNATAETTAALMRLKDICRKRSIDPSSDTTVFKIVGYSEGANQAASLSTQLLQLGAQIKEIVAVDPAGIVGYENPDVAHIWPQAVQDFRSLVGAISRTDSPVLPTETQTGYSFPGKLLKNYSDSIQHGHTQKDKTHMNQHSREYARATLENIRSFVKRLGLGLMGVKTPRGIQPERMKHVWSVNPDYSRVVTSGVPLTVFSVEGSLIAPYAKIESWVTERQENGHSVSLVSSTGSHFGPNAIPTGVGAALEFYRHTSKAKSLQKVDTPQDVQSSQE